MWETLKPYLLNIVMLALGGASAGGGVYAMKSQAAINLPPMPEVACSRSLPIPPAPADPRVDQLIEEMKALRAERRRTPAPAPKQP